MSLLQHELRQRPPDDVIGHAGIKCTASSVSSESNKCAVKPNERRLEWNLREPTSVSCHIAVDFERVSITPRVYPVLPTFVGDSDVPDVPAGTNRMVWMGTDHYGKKENKNSQDIKQVILYPFPWNWNNSQQLAG